MRRMISAAIPKKCARFPLDALTISEAKVGFVYDRGGLQGVARPLVAHVATRKAVEFGFDDWDKHVECGVVAMTPLVEQRRDSLRRGHGVSEIPSDCPSFRAVVGARDSSILPQLSDPLPGQLPDRKGGLESPKSYQIFSCAPVPFAPQPPHFGV